MKMKKYLIALAAVILAVSPACSREKKVKDEIYGKVTKATLPIESKYQADGPEEVSFSEIESTDTTIIKIVVARPTALRDGEKLPLVVLGNGSNTTADTFRPLMRHLASWGFVVIDHMDQQTATGASIVKMLNEFIAGADYVDKEQIAIAGSSQGATSSMIVATQSEVKDLIKCIYLCSCPQPEIGKNFMWGEYNMADVKVPILSFVGTAFFDSKVICPPEIFDQNYNNLPDSTPAVFARRIKKDHDKMAGEGDPYMTAWFRYWLKGDSEAVGAFKGSDAEILHNTKRWQDVKIQSL